MDIEEKKKKKRKGMQIVYNILTICVFYEINKI